MKTTTEADRTILGQRLVRALHLLAGAYASGNARRIARAEAAKAEVERDMRAAGMTR